MDNITFKNHYIQLLKKLEWLEKAKTYLEYNGDKFCNTLKYYEKLRSYNDQLAKYHRLQRSLLAMYGKQVKQLLGDLS